MHNKIFDYDFDVGHSNLDLNKKNEQECKDPFDNDLDLNNINDFWFTYQHYNHELSKQDLFQIQNQKDGLYQQENQINNKQMNDKSKELFKFDEKELQNCLDLNEILQNELDKIQHQTKLWDKNNQFFMNLKRKKFEDQAISQRKISKQIKILEQFTNKTYILNNKEECQINKFTKNRINQDNDESKLNISQVIQNKHKSISYVPPLHSTRDIRLWEKITNQQWYNLNCKQKQQANKEIQNIIKNYQNKI